MIMDSNYSWTQPEHNGPAQKLWSKVYYDNLKGKIIIQSQSNIHHLTNFKHDIPVYSTFSQNIYESMHNPPIKICDFVHDENVEDEKCNRSNDSHIGQFLEFVKKKRDYNKASTYFYEIQIQIGMISTHFSSLYPWNINRKSYEKSLVGFHEEILDFYHYIMPSEEEKYMRQEVIERLKQVIYKEWPKAVVDVFGSFKTELHLPTSDIDVVIFCKLDNPLWKLNDIIRRSGIASDCKVLDKATVPIVKMTDRESDVKIDISFNLSNGIESADLIKSYIKQYTYLPQLVLVLKQYLLQRDLNEVWTGGISSYSLILMCVSFLKHHSKKKLDNLGQTLILFLEMYGRQFDYTNMGIRTVGDISYVPKEEIMKNMDSNQWSSILCIEDPLNVGNDIGRSSYGALHVKLAFEYAYSNLVPVILSQSSHLFEDQKSILGRIIRITPEVSKYRDFIKNKYSVQCRKEIHSTQNQNKTDLRYEYVTKDPNTNNSNHKSRYNINERGDTPSKQIVSMSTGRAKYHNNLNQLKVSVLSDFSRNYGQTAPGSKGSDQVPNKHFKKSQSSVLLNCAAVDRH